MTGFDEPDPGVESGYWRALGVYLVGVVLGVVAIPTVDGIVPPILTGAVTVIVLFVLSVASVGVMYALFKDSEALAEANARWEPTWWVYVGSTVAVPTVGYYGTKLIAGPNAGVVVAVPTLVATAFTICAGYLYRRHDRLGVP